MHHGLCGYLPLYRAIDPEICLWPTTAARFLGHEVDEGGNQTSLARQLREQPFNAYLRDDSIRVRRHYHGEESIEIDMTNLRATPLD
jgi:hypothetical protein